jgi:RNA polymerase sigma-70 factor (ECF subfamily)
MDAQETLVDEQERDAIRRLSEGDTEAMGYLFDRYAHGVKQFVYDRVWSEEVAEDVMQETFLTVLRKVTEQPVLACDIESIEAYLITIAYGILVDKRRYVLRECDILEEYAREPVRPTPRPDEIARDNETIRLLLAAIADMPPERRPTAMLKYYQELDDDEIARLTNVSLPVARGRIWRSGKRLAKVLRPHLKGNRNDPNQHDSPPSPEAAAVPEATVAEEPEARDPGHEEVPLLARGETAGDPGCDRTDPACADVQDVPSPVVENGSDPLRPGVAESAAPGDSAQAAGHPAGAARSACNSEEPAAALSEVSAEAAEEGGRRQLHAAVGNDRLR